MENGKDPIYDIEKIASATECTGLIPAQVEDEAEVENYAELYAVHPVKPRGTRN
ncbi:MAG: hypothetical protein IJ461_07035 [Clostridia bacterium]|nr:hypothetical protein [Clostridia bacterium]